MYILIVSRGYPSDEYKMNGIFEFDQAKALVKAGYEVVFVAVDLRSFRRKRKWGFESFKKDKVQIEAINIPCGGISKPIQNKFRILALRELYKRIEKKYGKPDIVHAHFLDNGYATVNVFNKSNIPLILTEHLSSMNQDIINPSLMKLGKQTYPKFQKVITVSEMLAKNLYSKFGIKASVVSNIIDTNSFKYCYKKKESRSFCFIAIGSLIKRKGMDILIDSFNISFKENKNVYLYIYGDGPERSNLEKKIKGYGLNNQIFLMGLVDRKELAEKMNKSDCFVLASRLETFGVVYIEALAMGLPVIGTKCGGPETFVNNENGLLISVDDMEKLSDAMKYIYINIHKYDKLKIAKEIRDLFSPKSITEELGKIYREVIISKD
jgi:glycosyltransferase involved in cell wall biosynthesis